MKTVKILTRPLILLFGLFLGLNPSAYSQVTPLGTPPTAHESIVLAAGPQTLFSGLTVPAGTDRVLVVTVGSLSGSSPSVTFGGNAMTLGRVSVNGSRAEIWIYVVPGNAVVTGDVVFHAQGFELISAGAQVFSGVYPADPIRLTGESLNNGTSAQFNNLFSNANNMFVDCFRPTANTGTPSHTANAGQTEFYNATATVDGGGSYKAGSASTSFGWSWTEATNYAYAFIELRATPPPGPELDILNFAFNIEITDGSTMISAPLGTDYGSVCVTGGTFSRNFFAVNNGDSNLSLGADALSLSNTTDFIITTDLLNGGTISSTGSKIFIIQFDPASPGIKTCTVTVRSDDADEDPYTFLIQGVGLGDNTVSAASSSPTGCLNQTITPITHTTTGATGIGAATGLPPGTSAAFAVNTITISGAPSATGIFNYTIPLTGGCGTVNATGTITVNTVTVSCTGSALACNGANNGTASVAASGGTPGYGYAWSSGGSSATETGLTAGTYTVTVTDANGCTATCSTTVTEPTAVTASCTGGSVTCNGEANGTASVAASGGTPGYTYVWNDGQTTATAINLSAATYTVTVTDANFCTATCSTTVTEPATVVTASCTGGTVTCNGDSNGSVSVAASGGTPGYTYAWNTGGSAATETGLTAGTYTVTVTDANFCTATCSASVTVNDTENPVANCPATQTVNNAPGQCDAVVNFIIPAPIDNCPGATSSASPMSGSTFPVGTTPVTVTATDAAGNTSTCMFNVVVNDMEPPTVGNCNDFSVDLDNTGQYVINNGFINAQLMNADNCGLAASHGITVSPFLDCDDVGTFPVTFGIKDINGNETPCTVNLTVNDPINPVADCPANMNVDANAGCTANVNYPATNPTDNCPGATMSYMPPSGSNFPLGTTGVIGFATDASGNMSPTPCAFIVTVNDNENPVANCPPTQTVNNDPGQCDAIVNFMIPDPSDNCPGATSTVSPVSGSTFPVGTTPVTVTATDAAGNMSSCMFNVVVNDMEPPTVGNCNDFSVDLDNTGQYVINNGFINAQLMNADNCGLAASHGISISPFLDCDDLGPNTVTFGIKDINGNETLCTLTLTVNDVDDPVIFGCQSFAVPNASGECGSIVAFAESGATDNCDMDLSYSFNPPSGSFFPVGVTMVEKTATDDAGNSATCMLNVTVNDTESPVANCPTTYNVGNDPGQCDAVVNFMIPSPTDNCPGATSTANPPSGSTFPLGTTPVTVTATDAAGNMSSCMFNVIVTDDEDPVANCPTNIVRDNDPGQCGAIVNFSIPAPLDNCPLVNTSANPASGSTFPIGTTTVTVTATDNFTNFSTCTFTVTVNDIENPVASCPANINVNAGDAGCTAVVIYPLITPPDNCPGAAMSYMPSSGSSFPLGTTGVIGFATDASGNMSPSPCAFIVTVNNPVAVTCSATDETCAGANDGTATATPTGGTAPFSYQWDAAAGNQTTQTATGLAPGTYSVTVTDVNGCASACSSSTVGVGSGPCCPSSVSISANPSGDICLGTMGVQYNAMVTDGAATNTFAWCAYNNGTGSGNCFNGFSNNTIQNPTRNWNASTGAKSVGVTVSQAGCPDISDLYVFNVVKPAAPTPDQDMKMFCHGDPNITVGLAGTGVNVSNTLTGNERIVWELVSAPANSDLTPGFLNDNCAGPATNLVFDGEIRIANSSKVVRVDNVSVVNNMNQPIIGDYVFMAYLKDCDLDCISDAAGPFTITVKDPFPVIACPADMTVECGASIDPMDTGSPTTPTNSCCMMAPTVTHSDATAPGMCPVVEVITRTFTVNYVDCGLVSTCSQILTIEDNTPPDIVCPSDQTIEWPIGFSIIPVGKNTPQDPSIDPAITGMPLATDGCGLGEVPINCTTISGPVTGLNYNGLGLITTNFVINGVAPIPAALTCVQEVCVTVHMIADIGGAGFEQSNIRDEAGNIIGQNGVSNGDCNPDGAYSTMCIPVADYNSYAADGTLNFSIDTDSDIDNLCATQTIQASVEICSACGSGMMYQDVITGPNPANCPNLWVVERTWTVVDVCGVPATCVQTFTFTDTTPPIVNTCSPDPAPIEWPAGFNTQPVGPNTPQDPSIDPSNYPNIVYSDNCAVVSVDYQDVITGPTPGNCPNLWVVERTWTVTDACGLTGNCVQTFTFTDTTPPTIACPADPAPIEWPAGFNTAAVGPNTPQDPSVAPAQYGTATASDNCGTPTVTYQDVLYGPVPGDCPNLWTLQRTWTATDACGLTTTCVQTFTFTDTTPPVITTCPPPVAIEGCGTDDIAGNGHPPYSTVVAGTEAGFNGSGGVASDNCAIVAWNYVDVANGTCPVTVTRTWTVTDACGLTATCTQVFTIDDTTPPVVTCQDISITLGANATYNLQPTEVLASSSDNCGGAVTPVSVSPSLFDCQSFPYNAVTLTVEDACGNQGTCTATVFKEEFITNIIGFHSNETCAGANDGTITASATAGGGQIMYSLDGINFQPVGSFNNLAPGLHTLTIKVFGVPATCVETIVFDIQPGGPLLVCYADSDNDGYGSALTPPVTTCNCPAGYKTAAQLGGNTNNDCNDSYALINPGAAELCDGLDNDCDGIVPASESDADGDGYRVCENDCNDGNALINPGAAEICNGIDDNCNGLVDEGLNGLTYNGNVYFSTQAQVDAWPPCYSVINGSVTIVGVGINNLGALSNIVDITGGLTIQSTGLTSMSGLDALAHVGGTLTIYFNSSLTTLDGLEALNAVGGALYMYYNFQLSDCCAISDLVSGGVTGPMLVFFNKIGCNSVMEIITTCPANNPLIGNPNTGITPSSVSAEKQELSLYPNPAESEVTVVLGRMTSAATIRITDILGRVVYQNELEKGVNRVKINLHDYNMRKGVYLVTLTENKEVVTKQLVVQQP